MTIKNSNDYSGKKEEIGKEENGKHAGYAGQDAPKKFDLGPLKYFGLVGQIGMVIALPLILMIWVAQKVMPYFNDSVLVLLICIFSGLYAGFRNAYILLMKKR